MARIPLDFTGANQSPSPGPLPAIPLTTYNTDTPAFRTQTSTTPIPTPESITAGEFNKSLVRESLNFPADIQRGVEAIKSFGQLFARTSTSLFQSAFGIVAPQTFPESLPVPKGLQPLFGTSTIQNVWKEAHSFADSIRQSPVAQKLGLDTQAPALAFAGVLGNDILNTVGVGWGAEGEAFARQILKHSTDAAAGIITKEEAHTAISSLLKSKGVEPTIADTFTPDLAAIRNEADIANTLNFMKGLQHTAALAEANGTANTFEVGQDVSPAATADWEQNYAQKYATLQDQIAQLQTDAKTSKGTAESLAPRIQSLVTEQGTLEDNFLQKWADQVNPPQGTDVRKIDIVRSTVPVRPEPVQHPAPETVLPKNAPTTPADAADRYYRDVVEPNVNNGPVVVDPDAMKKYFGNDFSPARHQKVYSQGAFQVFKKAIAANSHPEVILTAGGPGAGKSEVLVNQIRANGFSGVVYDANLSTYESALKKIEATRAAGKEPHIYAILTDIERAFEHTLIRYGETGRAIPPDVFARGHAGFIETIARLIREGVISESNVHLLDTRNLKSLEEAKAAAAAGAFHTNPLALLQTSRYNEATLATRFTRLYGERTTNTGELQDAAVRQDTGGFSDQNRADQAARAEAGISEAESLDVLAQQQHGGEGDFALETAPSSDLKLTEDLTKVFADLKGVKPSALKSGLSAQDLEDARVNFRIAEDTLLDHPGRALVKYVSHETGYLPEIKGGGAGKFNKAGDTIFQDLVGSEASAGGDVVKAQQMVDDYKRLRDGVLAAKKQFQDIRAKIQLQKQAGKFVESSRRLMAREVAKDSAALHNLLTAAERAGFRKGSEKSAQQLESMIAELKSRRTKIADIQTRNRLTNTQMKSIMGRSDPRFMTAREFAGYRAKLGDRAVSLRQSLDRYGAYVSPGDVLTDVPKAEAGSWQSLIKNYYQNLGSKPKADFIDYLGTPEFVLERLGLADAAANLHEAQGVYRTTLATEISKIAEWKAQVQDIPYSSTRIFRYLDGREKEVYHEMPPDELQVARDIRAYLSQWADRLHLPEDNRISRYITHIFDPGQIAIDKGASIFDDPELAAIMQEKPAGSVYDPFLSQRLGKKGYKEDVWGALDAYVKRASRKEAMDPVLNRLAEEAKRLDETTYKYVATLTHHINMRPTGADKFVDDFIRYRIGIKRFGERPVAYLASKVRAGFYRGALGLNVGSALRNLSQGANTYAKLGEKYTFIGYAKILPRMLRGDLAELKDSGVLADNLIQDRKLGIYKTFLQKIDPVLFSLFDAAERINRGAAYYGAKSKALAQGLSEEQAKLYGARIVRETQFAFSNIDMPVALSSDIAKVFTQLQSYNIKQIEFLARMMTNREYAGLVRYTVASLGFVYTLGQLLGMTPSQILPSIRLFGSPLSSTAVSIYDSVFGRTPQDKATARNNLRRNLFARIPAGTQILSKTVPGIAAVARGKDVTPAGNTRYTIPRTPLNFIRAGIFGKSTLPQAQSYYKSLNAPKKSARPPL